MSDYPVLVKTRAFMGKGELNVYGPYRLKIERRIIKKFFQMYDRYIGVFKNWKVNCMPVKHFNSIMYRIDSNGKSILYGGDSVDDDNIIILGKDADIGIRANFKTIILHIFILNVKIENKK